MGKAKANDGFLLNLYNSVNASKYTWKKKTVIPNA